MIRKTKIVCTIGPATSSESRIRQLVEAGMNVARLNFSHGTHDNHGAVLQHVREISAEMGVPVAVLQDLAGPKVRIGTFPDGRIELEPEAPFTLTTRPVKGTDEIVSVSYRRLPEETKAGDVLLLADGTIELQVENVSETEISCRVLIGGSLSSRKGVNCPTGLFKLPILAQKDLQDLEFGIRNNINYVGLSFVRTAEDVRIAKRAIREMGGRVPVIAKIETQAALDHFEDILTEADGIMIARGDLSIETPYSRVPILQKQLIRKANAHAKPVITATQMLWSMVEQPRPSRAEVADVANAILDGSDAVMLSEETTVGNYPIRAVQAMNSIALETEAGAALNHLTPPAAEKGWGTKSSMDVLARTACELAARLDVDVIGTVSRSGQMVRYVSRYHPAQPILAVTPREATYRNLSLVRGAIPLLLTEKVRDSQELVEAAFHLVRQHGWKGKQAVFVGADRVRKGEI